MKGGGDFSDENFGREEEGRASRGLDALARALPTKSGFSKNGEPDAAPSGGEVRSKSTPESGLG